MSSPFQKIKIVKLFASSEYRIRNKAYKSVGKLLKFEFGLEKSISFADNHRPISLTPLRPLEQLSEKEILAIWKGLFVWLWMQDKPILHEEVVDKICKLIPEISSDKVVLEFTKAFFITMNREWRKIDVHRLDKFYMVCLCRRRQASDIIDRSFSWCGKCSLPRCAGSPRVDGR